MPDTMLGTGAADVAGGAGQRIICMEKQPKLAMLERMVKIPRTTQETRQKTSYPNCHLGTRRCVGRHRPVETAPGAPARPAPSASGQARVLVQ